MCFYCLLRRPETSATVVSTKKLRHRSSVALLLCRSSYCESLLSTCLLHHLDHLTVLTANDVDALLHGLKLTTREVVDCAIGSVGAG